jgi:pimeloyl-ACP methyl ester carboxylesterase
MTNPVILRDFAYVGERPVHYRIAGDGPPVLLLHQSPRNSAELVPLMRILARHFLVIAPDTPGYGKSGPVTPSHTEPNIDVFADAVISLLDVLGLKRAALFGSHTGAIIAVRVASRHPERISALVANGILMTTPEERRDNAERYLPPLVPQWDGGHLVWLWSRLRDQLVYYPWYRHDPATRIYWPQSLEETDAAAVDLIESGDEYRGAYGAVLAYDIADDLASLELPTLLVVARTDALSRFVSSYPPVPGCVDVSVVADFPQVPEATLAFLLKQSLAPATLHKSAGGAGLGLRSSFVQIGEGQLHLRRSASGQGRLVMFLHDLGSSAAALDPVLHGIAGRRPLLAPDLPGHAESGPFGATTPEQIAAVIGDMLDALDISEIDVVSVGTSAAIATAMCRTLGSRVCGRVAIDPVLCPDGAQRQFALVPDLAPDSAGSHLLRGWMYLRDRALHFPWHDRSSAAALERGCPPQPVERQRALLDLLKSRGNFPAQLEAALVATRGGDLARPAVTVLATSGAAPRLGSLHALDLPDERCQWGARVLRALEQSCGSGIGSRSECQPT